MSDVGAAPSSARRRVIAPGLARRLFSAGPSSLVLLLIISIISFTLLIGPRFLGPGNVMSMATQLPELGILSLAMMVSMLHGGVNLSIISTANLTAITTGYLLTTFVTGSHSPWLLLGTALAIVGGLLVAFAIGILNGVIIAYLRVSPILATLGTMIMVKGLALGLTQGRAASGYPSTMLFIGNGTILYIPFSVLLFLFCSVVVSLMLSRTALGQTIYLMGSNEEATRFSGVNTQGAMVRIYVISSVLAGIGGLVMMSRFNSTNASYGESYLLVTILAAVLGGVSPYGGFGKVGGLLLGLVTLQVLSSAFNQLGFTQFFTLAMWGLILIALGALSSVFGRGSGR